MALLLVVFFNNIVEVAPIKNGTPESMIDGLKPFFLLTGETKTAILR